MSVYDPKKATPEAWASLVEKQSKGLTPDEFTWLTPEDIPLKVLYTAEDTEALPYTNTMPGMSPYIRGPSGDNVRRSTLDHPSVRGLFDC